MIEPPRQPLVGAILEIDDRILVAVELIRSNAFPARCIVGVYATSASG